VTGRLWGTPSVVWAAIIVLFGLGFGAATVREAARTRRVVLTGVPLDGLVVTGGERQALTPGDRLVAIDGVRAFPQRLEALLTEIAAAGRGVTRRAGDGHEVDLALGSAHVPLVDAVAAALQVVGSDTLAGRAEPSARAHADAASTRVTR
jgi:hypothetical protein